MFSFLLGLMIGLGILIWKQSQINRQLTAILNLLSQFERVTSLSKIAQIRRNINLLDKNFHHYERQLDAYKNLLDIAPIGYLKIDADNRLIECNKEAKNLLSIQRWHSQKFRFFLELIRSYELDQLIQQTRKTKNKLMIEWEFFPSDDYALDEANLDHNKYLKPIFLQAYSYPIPENNVVIFLINQQLLHELTKRKDQAYSDLSHELRTPLTSLSLLSETLIDETEGQIQNWIKQIYQEINRLINLVQDWLNSARLEQAPYQNLQLQNLDLKQLIFSAWDTVSILAERENINFKYQGLNDVIIEADLNYLTQVFVNLFDNSIKHCSPDGLIQVHTQYQDLDEQKLVQIDVFDTGNGFHPDDLPYIFERLYRGDKSRARTQRQGSGLGLSIVKNIIIAHQGDITAQNHPETKGAWLQITIPILLG